MASNSRRRPQPTMLQPQMVQQPSMEDMQRAFQFMGMMQQPQQQFPQMLIPPGSYQPKRVRNNPKAPPSKASPLQQYAQLRASAAQMGINVVGPDGKALKKAALQAAIDAKKTPTSPPAQVATPAAPAIPIPPTAVPVIPPSVVVADTGSSAANPPNA